MGEDGNAARGADQGDPAGRVGGVAADVGAAAVGDPLGGEGVRRGGDHAGFGQGAGDVRPADDRVAGDRG